MKWSENRVPLIFAGLYVLLFFMVKNNPFFWDTIQLGSKHAHWYYENDFQYFFLPASIDSGHPPTFGMALAALWTIFGKSLWVGHAMILVFSIGIVFLIHRLGVFFLGEKAAVFLLLLVAVDPVFAGQSALVSPDIPLLFFWLLGLWAVLKKHKWCLVLAALGLASISMRGMMMVVVVYLFQVFWEYQQNRQKINLISLFKQAFPYIPSGLMALAFLWAHYQHTGWIGYHEDSPWAPSFAKVDASGFLKNIAVLGWRMLDYGRLLLWLVLLILAYKWWSSNWQPNKKAKALMALLTIGFIILIPSLLLHYNLLAHRYLMPLMLVLHFVFIYLLCCQPKIFPRMKLLFALVFIGLLTGNFWVYPKEISQGWDSTLAHLNYFPLREKMIAYIDEEGIPLETIATDYPENGVLKYMDLSEREDGFATQRDGDYPYVLYSNVMNDFSDEKIRLLENEYEAIKRLERQGVCLILYKK